MCQQRWELSNSNKKHGDIIPFSPNHDSAEPIAEHRQLSKRDSSRFKKWDSSNADKPEPHKLPAKAIMQPEDLLPRR